MNPIQVAFGWSRDETAFMSNAIRYFSRPGFSPFGKWAQWSHMFLVFRFTDGTAVIHEALMSEGWSEKPATKLADWQARDPARHHAELQWLDLDDAAVLMIYTLSMHWLGTKSYAVKQIAAFAIAESLLGRWLGLSVQSGQDEVICSEGACRLVGEVAPQYDLRAEEYQSWDSVSPQAAYDAFMRLPETVKVTIPMPLGGKQ